MNDDETDESNAKGKEVDTPKEEADKPVTPAEKVRKDTEELKTENDMYDVEKLRAETIRAERQRGGELNAGQAPVPPKDPDQEMADLLLAEDEAVA